MAFLLDVNLLVALLHPRHPHSGRALAWLQIEHGPASLLIARVVQMGALRLTTQPVVMQADVKSASEFWQAWDQIMRDDRFAYAEEPAGLTSSWRSLCAAVPRGTTAETDTYLAAFALAGGHTLATFDKGFARFPGLLVETPP